MRYKNFCLIILVILGIIHFIYCSTVITLGIILIKHQNLLSNTNNAVINFQKK